MKYQLILATVAILGFQGCAPMPSPVSRRPGDNGAPTVRTDRAKAPVAPVLEKLPNGHYRVVRNWPVELNGKRWVVVKGYTSNGITAPSYIKSQLGDGIRSRDTWAAVFHDWLFTRPGVSRAEADRLYYDLMLAYGVPQTKARLMYNTVSAYSLTRPGR